MTGGDCDQTGATRWGRRLAALVGAAGILLSATALEAATPVESAADLVELCELGAPEVEDESVETRDYHERRRRALYRIYETTVSSTEIDSMDYDRVSGLFTVSGFARRRPFGRGPSIEFRNQSVLKFEFDERRAHDLMAQLRMGTVQLRVGFAPAAHDDYDTDFCVDGDSSRRLETDLLYARLVDAERGEGGEVLDTYRTRRGYRWMLRRDLAIGEATGAEMPDLEVSHLQWRPEGEDWGARFGEGRPEPPEELDEDVVTALEESLYPCYLRALTENASLQGAVVIEVPVGPTGLAPPEFLMDTIRAGEIRRCLRERLGRLEGIDALSSLEGIGAFKATILMRRR